jgi:alkylation response protein AidB-like acyl-CoA dehydrogenase
MRIVLTDEQQQIGEATRDALAARPTPAADRSSAGLTRPFDDAGWRACGELGWFSLGVPDGRGGVGYGPVEEMVMFRELGRYLAPGPFLPTVAAGWVAAGLGRTDLAGELFAGRLRVGLGVGGYLLDARSGGLVAVVDEQGISLREAGELQEVASVDPSVRLAVGPLAATVARLEDPLLLARMELLVAAMHVGIAEAVRDMSTAYAVERHQFGRPIGAFQAVKHRCADMAIRCYAAYSQTLFASSHVERRTGYATFHACSARLVASSAARTGAADNIQNLGAIGFTQEHVAHWFVRRAQVLHQCLDPAASARQVIGVDRERYETPGTPAADWFAAAAAR